MGSFFDREVHRTWLETTTDRLTKRANEKKDIKSSTLETKKVSCLDLSCFKLLSRCTMQTVKSGQSTYSQNIKNTPTKTI